MKFELFQNLQKMTEKNNNSLMYICQKGKSHFALPILNFLSKNIKLYRIQIKKELEFGSETKINP